MLKAEPAGTGRQQAALPDEHRLVDPDVYRESPVSNSQWERINWSANPVGVNPAKAPSQHLAGLGRPEVVGAEDRAVVGLDPDPDIHPHEAVRADEHPVATQSEELAFDPRTLDLAADIS